MYNMSMISETIRMYLPEYSDTSGLQLYGVDIIFLYYSHLFFFV